MNTLTFPGKARLPDPYLPNPDAYRADTQDIDTAKAAAAIVKTALDALWHLSVVHSEVRGVCCPHDCARDLEAWHSGFTHTARVIANPVLA